MRETTIHAIFTGEIAPVPSEVLYLVRDGATTFFVGCAPGKRDILKCITRWNSEMCLFRWFVNYHFPASSFWQVELLTLEDGELLLGNDRYLLHGNESAWQRRDTIKGAEAALIRALCPCLTTECNPEPMLLPARYCPLFHLPFWNALRRTGYRRAVMASITNEIKQRAGGELARPVSSLTLARYIIQQQLAYNPNGLRVREDAWQYLERYSLT